MKMLAAAFVAFAVFSSCTQKAPAPSARTVHVAIWSGYLPDAIAQAFEKKTGIKPVISNYSSNEELLAKLQAGASGYDVVVPSDYMIGVMVKQGMLRTLDRAELPNAQPLDPKLLKKSFDPDNKYSVPFDWGTTGIAINPTLYKGKVGGWKELLEKPDLAGKFTLLDDVRETMGAALRALGFSINSRKPAEIAKAKELLIKARPRLKAFTSEVVPALANGETAVAQAYNTDALRARKDSGGKIDFVLPKEGCTLWIDCFAIPASAPHPAEAHEFIDFMLSPATGVG
ncbi:MAG TPA: spermidine/putrescine ABC transporter substrate-binding protein, partial [Bdellovibrionota bacterium]|nr:spermidine/putrescine ABC transporter substrate-binding protein [Bdellovibrionota bacterium]